MRTIFLEVPLKLTRRYDIGNSVNTLIARAYGADVASQMTMPCRAFGDLRNAAAVPVLMEVSGYRGVGVAALTAACKYVQALHYIARTNPGVLPDDRSPNFEEFCWRDAFSKNDVVTCQYRIEAVAFAYNYAGYCCTLAIRSARGAVLDRKDFQVASEMFLDAAGVFEYMPRMPYLVNGGSIDLHPPAHVALKYAMLANAQQLYYINAQISGRGSMELRAKLASGARKLYEITVSHLESAELRDTSMKGALLVPAQILCQCYIAETALCDSAHSEVKGRQGDCDSYGAMVAHCRKAMEAMERALQLTSLLPQNSNDAAEMIPAVEEKYEHCREKLIEAESANNNLYYVPVPSNVKSSEPLVQVEPSPMDYMFAAHADATIAPLSMGNS